MNIRIHLITITTIEGLRGIAATAQSSKSLLCQQDDQCAKPRIWAKAKPPGRLRQDCLGGPIGMRIAGPGDSTRVAMTCSKYHITSPSSRTYLDVSGEHTLCVILKIGKGNIRLLISRK